MLSLLGSLFNLVKPQEDYKKGNIAVIEIEGIITESLPILAQIRDARENDYKAMVVRVNSPGGAVGSSQEIYLELKKLSKELPLVVSMGDVAASGGLYVSLGAPMIYALPGTLTGSMGVLLELTNFSRLLNKMHIDPVTITSGQLKDAGNPMHPVDPKDTQYFQSLVKRTFKGFKADVQKERQLTKKAITLLSDGRVIEGTKALEIGLVDKLGTFQDAVDYAAEKGKVIDVKLAFLSRKPKSYFEIFMDGVLAPINKVLSRKMLSFQFLWGPGF